MVKNLDVSSLLDGASDPDARLLEAATVVLLRETGEGCECLMLAKTEGQSFGGLWVFPGGRVETSDGTGLEGARRAAVRELAEETGLVLDVRSLVPLSFWSPPPEAPKRYLTWFFVAQVPAGGPVVEVDGGEISDHVWTGPAAALASHGRGEIKLLPPTWITLHELAGLGTVAGVLEKLAAGSPPTYATRMADDDGVLVALWEPDAAYPSDDSEPAGSLATVGPRHRLYMSPEGWTYQRDT